MKKNAKKYSKAWAAGLSQAIVQTVAAFVEFDPTLEQAIGVMLTTIIVTFAPKNTSAGDVDDHGVVA